MEILESLIMGILVLFCILAVGAIGVEIIDRIEEWIQSWKK